ncbi:MAG TPA: GerMN domain-containing protein [Geobacteraceae bacterium]|nr:GerMN domain-containing protein [Geobacteraceae bacterium]
MKNRMARKNNVPRREWLVIFVAFLVCAVVLGVLFLKKYEERHRQPAVPPHAQQEGTLLVTLFFAAQDGSGLVREGREIDACEDQADCVESVVDELINGPLGDLAPTLPENLTVRSVQVTGDLAVIDLGEEMMTGLPGGSSAEMAAVYSIVDSVAINFPHIKQLKILVDGQAIDTLKGHLDLRGPLKPDFTLEKKPAASS